MNFRFKILDFRFLIVALIGIAFSACGRQEPIEYSLSDMQGLWKEDGTEHFMRFTTDAADSLKTGYLWGYEWDEGDGTEESDLFKPDIVISEKILCVCDDVLSKAESGRDGECV